MQRPTCSGIRIRSTRDAHIIFHAVSLGVLSMITRRLDADERLALRSGCVYAWEERGPHTEVTGLGIERFTEGRRWGPSRVRDEFLFYYEKSPPAPHKDKENPDRDVHTQKPWDPLVKQTYSVWVDSSRGRRKWHLTAYFTQATVDQLSTIDEIPELRGLEVPQGKYQSTRIGKTRRADEPRVAASHDVFRPANASATRTYAAFPLPYNDPAPQYPPHAHPGGHFSAPPHDARYAYGPPPVERYEPSHHYPGAPVSPSTALRSSPQHPVILPPLRAPPSPELRPPYDHRYPSEHYSSREYPAHEANAASGPSHPLPPYPHPAPGNESSYALRPAYYPAPPPSAYHPYHQGPPGEQPSPATSSTHSSLYPPRYSPYPASESRYSPYPPAPSAQPRHDYPHPTEYPTSHPYPAPYPSRAEHSEYTASPSSSSRTRARSLSPDSADTNPRTASRTPPSTTPSPRTSPSSLGHASPHTVMLPPLSAPVSDARDETPPSSPRSSRGSSSGRGVGLAPLRALQRPHPYRRENFDDQALKAFCSRR